MCVAIAVADTRDGGLRLLLLGLVGRLDVERPWLRRVFAPRLDVVEHVLLAHPAADPVSLDLLQVNPVLLGHSPDDR
jgi:hypothetical protein